jgi:hypothetical protein
MLNSPKPAKKLFTLVCIYGNVLFRNRGQSAEKARKHGLFQRCIFLSTLYGGDSRIRTDGLLNAIHKKPIYSHLKMF